MDSWVPFALQLAVGLLVAVTAAWATAFLSLRRFRQERIWERKVDAYSRVLEAVFDAREHDRTVLAELTAESRPSEQHRRKLAERAAAAWRDLDKHTSIGAFLLSERAAALLKSMQREQESGNENRDRDLYEYLDSSIAAYEKHLPLLRDAARADLQLRR